MSEQKLYDNERDIMEMDMAGNYYCRHVSAMTKEALHSKSDIAAELGWRDMQIDQLKAENEQLREKTSVMMGVGRGDGQLFVHGDYDSIKAAQAIVLELGALREQLNEARELLETCKLFYGCEHVKGMDDWLEANKP